MQNKQQKIVITGHKGFIGSRLYNLYKNDPFYNLVGIDLKGDIPIDIRDYKNLREACKDASVIYHLAAISSFKACDDDPNAAGTTNIQGTENVYKVAKEFNSRVIFASSAGIYGNQDTPCSEYFFPDPQGYYATTKLEGEVIAGKYLAEGVITTILRMFNVYGKGANPSYAGVVSNFVKRAMNNEPLIITGEGNQKRDFIYVDDVVDMFQTVYSRSFSSQYPLTLNVGTGQTTTIFDLASTVIGLTGSASKIIFSDADPGVLHSEANISSVKMHWQYAPINIVTGLSRMIKELTK